MSGKRPDPLEVRAAKGNPQRRPMPENVPPRIAGEPPMPARLSPLAREYWADYADLLRGRGQLSVDSWPALEMLANNAAEVQELQEDIAKNGRVRKQRTTHATPEDGDAGYMERARPQVAMLAEAVRRLRSILLEFGLTDASIGKVNTGKPESPDNGNDPVSKYQLQ